MPVLALKRESDSCRVRSLACPDVCDFSLFDIQLIPNEETKAAFREADAMKADLSIGKTYMDVDEMMEELLKK